MALGASLSTSFAVFCGTKSALLSEYIRFGFGLVPLWRRWARPCWKKFRVCFWFVLENIQWM